jgi:hypothetical protein
MVINKMKAQIEKKKIKIMIATIIRSLLPHFLIMKLQKITLKILSLHIAL